MRRWGERSPSFLTSDDAGKEVGSVFKPGDEGGRAGKGRGAEREWGRERESACKVFDLVVEAAPAWDLETWVPVLTFLLNLRSFVNCLPILGLGRVRVSLKPALGLKLSGLFHKVWKRDPNEIP